MPLDYANSTSDTKMAELLTELDAAAEVQSRARTSGAIELLGYKRRYMLGTILRAVGSTVAISHDQIGSANGGFTYPILHAMIVVIEVWALLVALRHRAIRFLASDSGRILVLSLMVALLAFGGVTLNRMVAASMLRQDAETEVRAWAASLVNNADDIPAIIAGSPPSEATKRLLKQGNEAGGIYRYKIWNEKGQLVFITDKMNSHLVPMTIADRHGQRIANSILSGSVFTEAKKGKPPLDPTYFAECYVPIKSNGVVIGVFEAYLDQTEDLALFQKSFFLTETIIVTAILLVGGILGFMVYRQMLAHRTAEAEAVFLANHDSLTGIKNRKFLEETATLALAASRRSKTYLAVLLMDLDRFKEINDSFGHSAGDEVLKEFARRMKSAVRAEDIVARLGGDEFIVLQVGMAQPSGARVLATRLLETLSLPYCVGDVQLSYGASIGVAIAPDDAADWDALLTCADVALYKSKAEGGSTVCFFEAGMDLAFRERRRLEVDLRRAVNTKAFQLAYQPLFNFQDGSLLGFEALLRWPEDWEPQSPAAFIPVAEESGLIVPLGAWVLETACRTAASWAKPMKIAVNLSPVQFRQGDIVASVENALSSSGLDPGRLQLEVTESLWIQNTDAVLDQLLRLRALGISIALDDFGTGYSSLSYLWKFPFDVVKIDRSFVAEMRLDPKAGAIVNTIVALGKTLDLTVTAEGVETEGQAEALRKIGCDQAQGYLFGRPLSSASANALVDASRMANGASVQLPSPA